MQHNLVTFNNEESKYDRKIHMKVLDHHLSMIILALVCIGVGFAYKIPRPSSLNGSLALVSIAVRLYTTSTKPCKTPLRYIVDFFAPHIAIKEFTHFIPNSHGLRG